MEFKDLIIFPLYLILIFVAFHIWQLKKGYKGRRWKLALAFKIVATLFIGLLYQFYYGGGDTFNFFHHSKQIWLATLEHPFTGLKLIFTHNNYYPEVGDYIARMWWYRDDSSMMVARISSIFGFLTFHSYLGISLFFALMSFTGSYAIYRIFSELKPHLKKHIFIIAFFIPSVAVWGSGLFKDTISFAATSWMIYGFFFGLIAKRNIAANVLVVLISGYIIYVIKIYILISLLPALTLWFFLENLSTIRSRFIKGIVAPVFLTLALFAGYTIINQITSENARYSLENISNTARITAMDIYAGWGAGSGSAYYLGEQDGSLGNFIQLVPSAIIVTLFRPWVWEVSNGIMVFSAVESLAILLITIAILFRVGLLKAFRIAISDPTILFCLSFSLILAMGVGIASYNFGTLSRYKIPLLPFYLMSLLLIFNTWWYQKQTDH